MNKLSLKTNLSKSSNLQYLILLLIIFFSFPRGIGVTIFGSVIDIVEILQFLIFIYLLPKVTLNTTGERLFILGVLFLPVISILFLLDYFPTNVFRYVFFIGFIFSGYFLGKYLYARFYNSKDTILKVIIYSNLFGLLIALINFNFEIIPLDNFRTYDAKTLERSGNLQRVITGLEEVGFASFRGNQMAANEFAIIQSTIFAITISSYYLLFNKLSKLEKFIFLSAIIISLVSIVLSQSRGVLVISIALLFFLGIRSMWKNKLELALIHNPFFYFIIIIFAYAIIQPATFIFLITNISTLLNYFGADGLGGTITNDESSKRIVALEMLIPTLIENPEIMITGLGEGFWNYYTDEKGIFSDSGLLVTHLLEFGLISYAIFFSYTIRNIYFGLKSRSKFITILSIALMIGIIASSISSFKTAHWYLFLLLGIISEHFRSHENRYYNDPI